jgi:hypothetical protein
LPMSPDGPLPRNIRNVDHCHTTIFENHSDSVKVRPRDYPLG